MHELQPLGWSPSARLRPGALARGRKYHDIHARISRRSFAVISHFCDEKENHWEKDIPKRGPWRPIGLKFQVGLSQWGIISRFFAEKKKKKKVEIKIFFHCLFATITKKKKQYNKPNVHACNFFFNKKEYSVN